MNNLRFWRKESKGADSVLKYFYSLYRTVEHTLDAIKYSGRIVSVSIRWDCLSVRHIWRWMLKLILLRR